MITLSLMNGKIYTCILRLRLLSIMETNQLACHLHTQLLLYTITIIITIIVYMNVHEFLFTKYYNIQKF